MGGDVQVIELLTNAGAVCGSLAAVGVVVGGTFKLLVTRMVLDPLESRMDTRFGAIEYELRTNGGGSLRDELRKTKDTVQDIYSNQRVIVAALNAQGVIVPEPAGVEHG